MSASGTSPRASMVWIEAHWTSVSVRGAHGAMTPDWIPSSRNDDTVCLISSARWQTNKTRDRLCSERETSSHASLVLPAPVGATVRIER